MLIFNQIVATIKALTRKCPKCGQTKVVKPAEKDRSVICGACGQELPPPKRAE